jgi:hypothetical protein
LWPHLRVRDDSRVGGTAEHEYQFDLDLDTDAGRQFLDRMSSFLEQRLAS